MQIAKFRANYRLNTPSWYQEVAGDSAENLQRKTVILLAEISSQLYQNHLDNEKIMGALAMMNLQSSELTKQLLGTQVNDVNTAISNFASAANTNNQQQQQSNSSSSSSNSSSSSTNPYNYDTSNVDPSSYDPNNPPTTVPTQ